jgi:anthranilate phosphoribosyltransferase
MTGRERMEMIERERRAQELRTQREAQRRERREGRPDERSNRAADAFGDGSGGDGKHQVRTPLSPHVAIVAALGPYWGRIGAGVPASSISVDSCIV